MDDAQGMAQLFEGSRAHLRSVAYRMLGSAGDADDAVQESWLRISRAGTQGIENPTGWMTTIVARVCLDVLRSRAAHREEPADAHPDPVAPRGDAHDPEYQALLADAVGHALLVVLERLSPAERVAFVLHDMFDIPFEEIAELVERSPAATRQLASRARRRVQGASATREVDEARQHGLVQAFLAASRAGDFEALLAVLDPEVVLRADGAAAKMGAAPVVRGAVAVAGTFKGRAVAAELVRVDGQFGLAWSTDGTPRVVFEFLVRDGRIAAIDLQADPERLQDIDLTLIAAPGPRIAGENRV